MKIGVFSMKDEVSGLFAEPFFGTTDGVALRKFANTMEQPDVQNKFVRKQDIVLFRIASYDNESGRVEAVEPVALATAANVEKIILGSDVQAEAKPMTEEQFAQERAKEV